ncbi:putative S-adenosylmethionine-dependent methyltransferase [mine drainage metagenome]|uniref:Putative S-adenosylmethionine-dependent methyltransferase n=1 Tax=mine drainage metagenome TaxID=410659 RepID=A0A1J5QXB4_9ZZZZ
MSQDDIFFACEGDAWFRRNKAALGNHVDWPSRMFDMLGNRAEILDVAELGCANGWRLNGLANKTKGRLVGVDASKEAILDGSLRYPRLQLHHGLLTNLPIEGEFDLVIVNFVFHWIDRSTLATSLAEVDRVTRDGGFLILGDFLPNFSQRVPYHHLSEKSVYTYKQDYACLFLALGTYREVARITFNHDHPSPTIKSSPSEQRAVCVVLQKSLQGYYHDISHSSG